MESRRHSLRASAAAVVVPKSVLGANGRVQPGVVGVGGCGTADMGRFVSNQDCAVAAVCDVAKSRVETAAKTIGGNVASYGGYRLASKPGRGGRGGGAAAPQPAAVASTQPTKFDDHVEEGSPRHIRNSLYCVKSRQKTVCDMETGFYSTLPLLLAADFVRFVELAKKGHPLQAPMLIGGRGRNQPPEYRAALLAQQRVDLERSFEYARKALDVGIRWRA